MGAHMLKLPKGPLFPIVVGVVTLAAIAVLVTLMLWHPGTTVASSPPQPQASAALSEPARVALRDMIEAQGLRCPTALDATLQSEAVVRVSCDNDQSFKVTMGPQSGSFHIAPWQ